MSKIIRSYIVDIVEIDNVIHCGKDGLTYNIEAVKNELVRCKDCKHYESYLGAMMVCSVFDWYVKGDDYCSHGERRE